MSGQRTGDYREGGPGFGNKWPDYMLGAMSRFRQTRILAELVSGVGGVSTHASEIRMTCPDSRLISTLTLLWVPKFRATVLDWTLLPPTVHLSATSDVGGDVHPVEDLLGTAAVPVAIIQSGLNGLQYSPTEEVQAIQADAVLPAPMSGSDAYSGKWMAEACWQALRPMSEVDWRLAVSLCKLEASPSVLLADWNPG
jgi:hypothetical protein